MTCITDSDRPLYFDYDLQTWVKHGVCQPCAHPDSMRNANRPHCCDRHRFAGMKVEEARACAN